MAENPFELTAETPVYVISVAAQLSGLHPQTLRQYDRLGLVSPGRSAGRGRRYSARDIEQLREVQRLSQHEGINLAGVKRILELENHVDALRQRVDELQHELADTVKSLRAHERERDSTYRRVNLPIPLNSVQSSALVVWRPTRKPR